MGKRKKGRCVKNNTKVNVEADEVVQAPHSFVIHKGLPGGHTLDLTKDFRKVMEPFTAISLKERKKNSIKDFVSIAGLWHVSHLSIFSRTELGMYLKICRLPRGPTLNFKIHNYSLSRDVVSSLKKQLVVEDAFKHSPLIVLNSFSGEGMQMKLMATMFQNMFPTINLTNVDLNRVRRCVLLNYNPTTKLIDFRHYNIKVVPVGVSKGVKKVVQGKIPNLARCKDISDFFAKTAVMSDSEAEVDTSNHITLAQKIQTRGNIEAGKSAIRLSELGPRLSLQLIKIEDGLLDGEVLYHDLVHKSEEEKAQIEKQRMLKKKLKATRRKIQEENTRSKDETKQRLKEKSLQGMQKGRSETDIQMRKASREANQDVPFTEDDDKQYYRDEVGEEPDAELFPTKSMGMKRSNTFGSHPNNKRVKFSDTNDKSPFKRNSNQSFNDKKRFKNTDGRFNKSADRFNKKKGDKDYSFNKSKDNNKFNKGKGKRVDKTNSHNRDQRPIGGKSGRNKFKGRK